MIGGRGCVAVMAKGTVVVSPLTLAVTVTVPFADDARVTVVDAWPLLPVAPLAGLSVAAPLGETLQVTVTPGSAFPFVSFTSTTSGLATAEPACALCEFPLTRVSEPGVMGVAVA